MKKFYGENVYISVNDIINFDGQFEKVVSERNAEFGNNGLKFIKRTSRKQRDSYVSNYINNPYRIQVILLGLTKFVVQKVNPFLSDGYEEKDKSIEWAVYLLKKFKGKYLEYAKASLRKYDREIKYEINMSFGSYVANHKEAYKSGEIENYSTKIFQKKLLETLIRDIEAEAQEENNG